MNASAQALTLTFALQRPADAPADPAQPLRFSGIAYSGDIVPHYGWMGDIAIDLASLQNPDGDTLPVLIDHDTRIGSIAGRGEIRRQVDADVVGAVAGVVAIDGKTACGSGDGHNTALHTISAFATASGLCLGQEHTRGKGNEIPAIKALLDTLVLKGCIVTIDAIGCQTEIAQQILDRGGDYLLAVKDNQETLVNALREFFADGEAAGFGSLPISRHQTIEKDHGRIETRRAHWWIENSLHWVLDVTFREDDCRVRKDHAPHNFAALRKFARALQRQNQQYPKRSLRSRRKTAERLPDYRASLLGLPPRG